MPVSFVGDVRGTGTVRNLSSDGCKIEADVQTRDTHLLVLRLSLPDETLPVVIDVAAVRWSKRLTFGVQFLSMKAAATTHRSVSRDAASCVDHAISPRLESVLKIVRGDGMIML